MATKTTLLGLTKSDYADYGDVGIQNSNLDLLDDAIAIRSRTPGMVANGIVAVSGTAPANTNRLRVGLYAYAGTIVGDYVTLKNIDLYFGTYTAGKHPIFVPKRYSEELLECRRYYQRRSAGNINPIDLCPLMADTPTVSAVDGVYEYVVDPNEVIE